MTVDRSAGYSNCVNRCNSLPDDDYYYYNYNDDCYVKSALVVNKARNSTVNEVIVAPKNTEIYHEIYYLPDPSDTLTHHCTYIVAKGMMVRGGRERKG
eukprot:scaffold94905_cov36-Cyclotella_meneghiniana.AAC.6